MFHFGLLPRVARRETARALTLGYLQVTPAGVWKGKWRNQNSEWPRFLVARVGSLGLYLLMRILNFDNPHPRLTEAPDGTLYFDGPPDALIAILIEDAVAAVRQQPREYAEWSGKTSMVQCEYQEQRASRGMTPHSRAIFVQFARGVAVTAAIYAVIAGTYGITRWLTFRELRLASEIETDTKTIAAVAQAVSAGCAAAISYGVVALLRSRGASKDRG
jgi:hypothetical protein